MSTIRQMGFPASTAWLLHILVVILAIVEVGAAEETNDDQHARRKLIPGISSFTGIDCGIAEGTHYDDDSTGYRYFSDEQYVNSGTSYQIYKDFISKSVWQQLTNVRSFPQGNNSCYTLKPSQARGNKYLIRALFMYGNYDLKNQTPEFALFVDVNKWDDVKLANASDIVIKEIVHEPATDYIHVCLVNTGNGTPFISALELIQLNNTIYKAQSGSLVLYRRLDVGVPSESIENFIRYKDDFYGRIWEPYSSPNWQLISAAYTSEIFADNVFQPSPTVMRTAVKPVKGSSLEFVLHADPDQHFYLFIHLLEVEQVNVTRKFNIFLNDAAWSAGEIRGGKPNTIYSTKFVSGDSLSFRLEATNDSTLPPILNALEYYMVKEFPRSPSAQSDVDAIIDIKKTYGIKKNWQGDPCMPMEFRWDGLECSYNNQNGSRIISLNLSSSGLAKEITPSLSELSSLQHLDLSNNSLTGKIPGFLADMLSLRNINLSGNKLTGSVPDSLTKRLGAGTLILSVDGNPDLCLSASCNKKDKIKPAIVVLIAVLSFLVLLVLMTIIWKCTRKRREMIAAKSKQESSLRFKSQIFTYPEIISITNNFEKIVGRGGSATVYLGYLKDKSQVAVKVLSPSSVHSSKVFETEVQLLMKIHHKNLASFIGYCSEGTNMVLIYEYMPEGNLNQLLSEKTKKILSWKERLQVALDAAQGLEYLHNGCKTPIIHRDMKPANILLNENLQAKIADFGLSRILATDESHYTTGVAGTHGYLDPEYTTTSRLTDKSDVYSFGIILLELITGQPAIIKNSEIIHIVDWVSSKLAEGDIHDIMDPRLQGAFNVDSAWKVLETAVACVPSAAIQRIRMSDVLTELKESMAIVTAHESIGMTEKKDTNPNLPLEEDFDSEKGPYPR